MPLSRLALPRLAVDTDQADCGKHERKKERCDRRSGAAARTPDRKAAQPRGTALSGAPVPGGRSAWFDRSAVAGCGDVVCEISRDCPLHRLGNRGVRGDAGELQSNGSDVATVSVTVAEETAQLGFCDKPALLMPSTAQLVRSPCAVPWSLGFDPAPPAVPPRKNILPQLPPRPLVRRSVLWPGADEQLLGNTTSLTARMAAVDCWRLPDALSSSTVESNTSCPFNPESPGSATRNVCFPCPGPISTIPHFGSSTAPMGSIEAEIWRVRSSVAIRLNEDHSSGSSTISNVLDSRTTNANLANGPHLLPESVMKYPLAVGNDAEQLTALAAEVSDILAAMREGDVEEAELLRQGITFFTEDEALNALVADLPEQESGLASIMFSDMCSLGLILPVEPVKDLQSGGCRQHDVQYKFCLKGYVPDEQNFDFLQPPYISRETFARYQNGAETGTLTGVHSIRTNEDSNGGHNSTGSISERLAWGFSEPIEKERQQEELRNGSQYFSNHQVLRSDGFPSVVDRQGRFTSADETQTSSGSESHSGHSSTGHGSLEFSQTSPSPSSPGQYSLLTRRSSSTSSRSASTWVRSPHDKRLVDEYAEIAKKSTSNLSHTRQTDREPNPELAVPPNPPAPANAKISTPHPTPASAKPNQKTATPAAGRFWSTTVGAEVATQVSRSELRRQEAIFELIESEKEYLRDLELLHDHFMLPLLTSAAPPSHSARASPPPPNPIDQGRRPVFVSQVFGNLQALIAMHKDIARQFKVRQRESAIVEGIGDIFLRYTADFECYLDYAPVAISGKEVLDQELNRNPSFGLWLEHFERYPVVRKLSLDSFRFRPLQRLARYPLLLNEILKCASTEADDSAFVERDVLSTAMHVIRAWLDRMDETAGRARDRLRLRQIHDRLRFKTGEDVDLGLLEDGVDGDGADGLLNRPERDGQYFSDSIYSVRPRNRRLIREGILKYRQGSLGESTELQVFLFDNVMLLTKKKKVSGNELEYRVFKRPTPLELVHIAEGPTCPFGLLQSHLRHHHRSPSGGGSDPAAQDACFADHSSLSVAAAGANLHSLAPAFLATSTTFASGAGHATNAPAASPHGYPFVVRHLGRRGSTFIFHASSPSERSGWTTAIEDAVKQRLRFLAGRQIQLSSGEDGEWDGEFKRQVIFNGPKACDPTCSSLCDHGRKILLGANDGVYMSQEGNAASLRRVIPLDKVANIETMEEAMLLFVLADKTLMSFSLEEVNRVYDEFIASSAPSSKVAPTWHKIASGVSYFNVGTCKGRQLVIHHKGKGLNSHFKVLEPASKDEARQRSGLGRLMLRTENKPAMKVCREFYVPAQSWSVQFLRAQICVVSERGFEVIGLDVQKPTSVPSESVQIHGFDIQKLRPISLFRLREGEFLLCYDEIAFVVDHKGRRKRSEFLIVWESEPTAFALRYPFVLAFDQTFIEVRHVETGRLVQAMAGNNLRCLNTAADAVHCVQQGRDGAEFKEVFKIVRQEVAT